MKFPHSGSQAVTPRCDAPDRLTPTAHLVIMNVMNARRRLLLWTVGGLIIVLLIAVPRLRGLLGGGPSSGGGGKDRRLPVAGVVLKPEKVADRILATGTVLADEEVELRSETSGRVVRISFTEGSRVAKGDLLLKIDDAELQAQLLKLDSQRKLAEDKERRRRQLLERQNISPEDYDIALNELNAIRAEIQLIEARIAKTEIRAPFDGVIGLRFVSEGSYVSPSTRIASLQDTRAVKVDFAVPERFAPELRRGQEIRFRIAGRDERFPGVIYAVEPKIDPSTRTALVRARAPNRGGSILPGGFAELELTLRTINDALMVPSEALVPGLEGQKVYVYRGGVAEERRVETGLRTDRTVQVTAGLAPFDTVITSGILQLVSGLPVNLSLRP